MSPTPASSRQRKLLQRLSAVLNLSQPESSPCSLNRCGKNSTRIRNDQSECAPLLLQSVVEQSKRIQRSIRFFEVTYSFLIEETNIRTTDTNILATRAHCSKGRYIGGISSLCRCANGRCPSEIRCGYLRHIWALCPIPRAFRQSVGRRSPAALPASIRLATRQY